MSEPVERALGRVLATTEMTAGQIHALVEDMRIVREKQIETQDKMASIQASVDCLTEMKDQFTKVEQQVDDLISLRNRMGGVALACVVIGGVLVKFWGLFAATISALPTLLKLK